MSEKSLNSREVCDVLKALFEKSETVKIELELSVNDTVLTRRAKGLQDYGKYMREYMDHYENAREGLLSSVKKEDLLDFIIEEAVSKPELLIDLALKTGVSGQWSGFPGRGEKE